MSLSFTNKNRFVVNAKTTKNTDKNSTGITKSISAVNRMFLVVSYPLYFGASTGNKHFNPDKINSPIALSVSTSTSKWLSNAAVKITVTQPKITSILAITNCSLVTDYV